MIRLMRNFYALLFGVLAGVILGLLLIPKAHSAAPTPTPPNASFIVTQCNELIVAWIVLANGAVYRADTIHLPKGDYVAWLKWLQTGPTDVYTLPCPTKI